VVVGEGRIEGELRVKDMKSSLFDAEVVRKVGVVGDISLTRVDVIDLDPDLIDPDQ
jgi:hypothetical protein